MKKALLKFVWIYLLFTVVFMLMKPVFMLVYAPLIGAEAADWYRVVWHGLPMDLSVSGYLTLIPGLLIMLSLISGARWLRVALKVYMCVITVIIAVCYCLDLGLYGTWGFRLEMSPLFYFSTSPAAALASIRWWHWVLGALGMAGICIVMWLLYRVSAGTVEVRPVRSLRQWWQPVVMLLVTGLLIIPIRGSVTVSTMNLSRSYFSTNQRLNHAAINPVFSLLYSATHQNNFDSEYDFMPDDEAQRLAARFLYDDGRDALPAAGAQMPQPVLPSESRIRLTTDRPDIVLIIIESFSSHLMPSLGGSPVAVGLDSIAREGVLFTNFYGSAARTDRALGAILASFPAPTGTSLLKYADKFEKLPGLPSILCDNGYDAEYYYGGDANFTNMQAFLVSQRFNPIISDKDFPLSERASKWGTLDATLFERTLQDMHRTAGESPTRKPRLTVVQTSSSHEPFEVPYANPRFAGQPRRNAFAYTDSCLTQFVNALRALPGWKNMLVVITPDHYGCWPEGIGKGVERHRIPLVLTGGALAETGRRVVTPMAQTDMGATLLGMLGIRPHGLRYSRDIFASGAAPTAFFTEPGVIGLVTPADTLIYDPDARRVLEAYPPSAAEKLTPAAQALLRDLYHTLEQL